LKEQGAVIQTVAFSSYLNTEKHEAFDAARTEVEKEVAAAEGFEIIPRSELRKMEADDRMKYVEEYRKIRNLAKPKVEALKAKIAPVDVADFVDHIDYLVDKMGIAQVGISSDFDGGGGIDGWSDASETFNVTLELVKRGYTEEQIGMLWSGNLLRVLDEVQAVAAAIQARENNI
jgi:membrane dipeptidase/D-alanyl-D-alanine dipeptidase